MTYQHLSRRQLMHILSVGAGGYAFSKSENHWGMSTAEAANPKIARFVYFHLPQGTLAGEDFIKNGGTATDFNFGVMTEPLKDIKDQVVLLDNIELVKSGGGGCTHNMGLTQILTGAKSINATIDNQSTGISLDHFFRKEIGLKVTPGCPSLLLSAFGPSLSYDDAFKRTGAINNPMDVYNKYLMGLTGGGVSPAQVSRLKTRKSVLDSVAKDLAAFQKTLPAEAKVRADAQADVLQSLSARVDKALSDPPKMCSAEKPAPFNASDSGQFPLISKLHCDMLVSALACDVTRVGMLSMFGYPHGGPPMGFAPINRPDLHCHLLSHTDIAKDGGAGFRKLKQMCFQNIANFALALRKIPEPVTGGSMLDNTIILVGTEIGEGHTQSGLQLAMIGGQNLGVRTGRLLRFGGRRGEQYKGLRINRVLVAIKNAMGIPGDTFNATSDQSNGSIPAADFTGPAPGLLA